MLRSVLSRWGVASSRVALRSVVSVPPLNSSSSRRARASEVPASPVDILEYPPSKTNWIFNICPQGHTMVVERLGKFLTIQQPGWFLAVPILDEIKYVHDMRELTIPIHPQPATSKDNVRVDLGGNVFVRFVDPYKASYGARRPLLAVVEHAKSVMRAAVGQLELDELFHDRKKLNSLVKEALMDAAPAWGAEVLRYEVTDIIPDDSISRAMDLQAAAEREKRQKVKNAEADKQAVVLAAEAQKQRDANESEGQRTRLINEAEGKARKIVLEAEAERTKLINEASGHAEATVLHAKAAAQSILHIARAIATREGTTAMQYELAQKYFESLQHLGKKSNTIFMPNNLGDATSMLAQGMTILRNIPTPDKSISNDASVDSQLSESLSSTYQQSARVHTIPGSDSHHK